MSSPGACRPPDPFRLAALDLGSLTVRLGIAELRDPAGPPQVVLRQERVTRLGQGLAADGRLSAAAQAATLQVVAEFLARCRAWQVARVRAVATQAIRQAANREDFLSQVASHTGLPVDVLSPADEAQLSLRGVLAALDPLRAARRPLAVFDLGGGSLEWSLLLPAAPPAFVSLPVGALTLLHTWPAADPPRPAELAGLRPAIRLCLLPLQPYQEQLRPLPAGHLVGSGGAATTLAALQAGWHQGAAAPANPTRLSRHALAALLRQLASLPQAERARLPGLSPAKADVILPGVALILEILQFFAAPDLLVVDSGLLEGVLARLADEVRSGQP